MITTKTLEGFFEEGKAFVELLPYFSYENGYFVLKDGSLGQIWEISLLESETKSTEELEGLAQMIEGIIIRLPEEVLSCQFILSSDSGLDKTLQSYTDFSSDSCNEIARACSRSRVEHLVSGKDGFFDTHIGMFSSKRIRCFFTMRYFPKAQHLNTEDKIRSYFTPKNYIREKIWENFLSDCQSISRFAGVVEGVFRASQIKFSIVDEVILHELLYKILNPKRSKRVSH